MNSTIEPLARPKSPLRQGVWTLAGYGISMAIRFSSNIVLARLLAPRVFGVMVVVNALRIGIELLTDVGVEQNIVHKENSLEETFFNTAWTLQILRGALITTVFLCLSVPFGRFYSISSGVFFAVSFVPLLNSLHSTSIFALTKKLDIGLRNFFECGIELFGLVVTVLLALSTPTVWALICGILLSTAVRSATSYCLPHPQHRFVLDRNCVKEIIRFGKWIFFSSCLIYCASNVDRLFLGKLAPFELLGIYGIARTMAEILSSLANRLGYQVVFPALATRTGSTSRIANRAITEARYRLCISGAVVVSLSIAGADLAVQHMYNARYDQVGWMLATLLFGTWFAILSNLNEAVLLGYGKPSYSAYSNGIRLAAVGVSLPLAYKSFGVPGAIATMIIGEIIRYLVIAVGQRRFHCSFYRQDAFCTGFLIVLTGILLLLRNSLGMGNPWQLVLHGGHIPSLAGVWAR
jgi:O-antigen/teichoic acid export membrane protein